LKFALPAHGVGGAFWNNHAKRGVMVWLLLLAVIVLLVLAVLVTQKRADGAPQTFPYQKQPALFTPAERSFYGVLHQAVGKDFQLFGKVRVADVIAVRRGLSKQAWQRAFNQINAKHFDFILCRPDDLSVLCAIELNDSSHQSKARQDRDAFLATACAAAGLPLISFDTRRAYAVSDICTRIADRIAGAPAASPPTIPAKISGTKTPNTPEPPCPKCASPMVKRVAKGGQLAGKEFWGCSRFPECRGMLSV